jgi:hypothetical protein
MFISIDHIPNMHLYVHKEYPTEPTIINLSQIMHLVPFTIYPRDQRTEITKIVMSNYSFIYIPFTFDEALAIIRNSTNVRDFRVAIGDYYVEVRKYESPPADIDKCQLATLGR